MGVENLEESKELEVLPTGPCGKSHMMNPGGRRIRKHAIAANFAGLQDLAQPLADGSETLSLRLATDCSFDAANGDVLEEA